ncbi:MAG: hypothetical protein DA330_08540 [Nitrososphaera sp.]|nr:hypothetical protein [Nitrososphaera sp.]
MEDLLRLAIKHAESLGASETEVCVASSRESEVFIENNDLKQAKSQVSGSLGLRVILNGSLGFYSTNRLDRQTVLDCAQKAIKIARVSPKDKFNTIAGKSKVKMLAGIYDRKAESFEPADAASMAKYLLDSAKFVDNRVSVDSGNFTSILANEWLANSNGVLLEEKISAFSWSIMGMAIDGDDVSSFDVQSAGTHQVEGVNVQSTATEFAKTVVNSLGAKKSESFKGAMILTPSAFADLLEEPITNSINSDAVQKKASQFAGKIGKKVASNMLTIEDDATNTECLGAASFDREGVPHRRNIVIKDGVLQKFLYNSYTAGKDGVRSTGNAGGSASMPPDVSTTNLVVGAGRSKLETMVSELNRGVLVSRFSGNVNPVNGDFSGVVKGGRIIKDGEFGHPVKELMIAGNVFDCLKNITAVSRERKVLPSSILPYMTIDGVSFTSG